MPKEITHWLLAEKTVAQLSGTEQGAAALNHPNLVKMGAVFPDLPYYLTGTDDIARRSREVGNEYHGAHGEDTYALLRTILDAPFEGTAPTPERRAFLVGVASHLQADMVFHPLVYFMTGNYHDPDPARRTRAIRNHRRFEGLLDLYVCGGLTKARTFSARAIWDGLECQPDTLLGWAAWDPRHPELRVALDRAARKFLAAQGLFIHPPAAWLANVLDPLLSDAHRELSALFYTSTLARSMDRLSGTLAYRNPVSGQSHSATVDKLLDRAVDESVALCRRLESVLASGDASRFTERGPSLNFGLVEAAVSQARHFSCPTFFRE